GHLGCAGCVDRVPVAGRQRTRPQRVVLDGELRYRDRSARTPAQACLIDTDPLMNHTDADAQRFPDQHVARLQPLARTANLASWEAATTGREEAIRRSAEARTAVKKLYSESSGLRTVRRMLESPGVTDPLVRRQLELLDHSFTANQLPA